MMPPLISFDDVGERKRCQKITDDLRAMTTLGPRTLSMRRSQNFSQCVVTKFLNKTFASLYNVVIVFSMVFHGNKITAALRHADFPQFSQLN